MEAGHYGVVLVLPEDFDAESVTFSRPVLELERGEGSPGHRVDPKVTLLVKVDGAHLVLKVGILIRRILPREKLDRVLRGLVFGDVEQRKALKILQFLVIHWVDIVFELQARHMIGQAVFVPLEDPFLKQLHGLSAG